MRDTVSQKQYKKQNRVFAACLVVVSVFLLWWLALAGKLSHPSNLGAPPPESFYKDRNNHDTEVIIIFKDLSNLIRPSNHST
jgi:hypothetical protein